MRKQGRKSVKIRLVLVLVVLGALGVFTVASALDDDSPETAVETCYCAGETEGCTGDCESCPEYSCDDSDECCCDGETEGCTGDCDDCDAVHSDGDDCGCGNHNERRCGGCH